ncbi:unnamed protein product [Rotaria socialis]|uniref:Uncharacterized protein n=1 Tax=Rotaria socialis TaxID=392032 RepID=A0A821ULQ4_9BILA|nr:unnamed protein product [Rotaria socialis]CAF4891512.1 unnamed protein product [Rotaria socialis]
MCRLDYSPLGRKLELFDGGFSAYCGFIHTECVHRHPIMLVFVSHILRQCKIKQFVHDDILIGVAIRNNRQRITMSKEERNRSLRAIRKWHLGLLLARNPMIVFFCKAYLNRLHMDDIQPLNALNNDDPNNIMNHRMSTYAHYRSASRASVASMMNTQHRSNGWSNGS